MALQEFKNASIDEIDMAINLLQNLKVARQKLDTFLNNDANEMGNAIALSVKRGRGRPKGRFLPATRKGSIRAHIYDYLKGKGEVKVHQIFDHLCQNHGKKNDLSLRVSISKVLNNPRDKHILKVRHGVYSFIDDPKKLLLNDFAHELT